MITTEEVKELLLSKLQELNIYDLERLRECFQYSYKVEPENKECIEDILRHIEIAMDEKAGK